MACIRSPRPVSPVYPRPLKGARGFSGNMENREAPFRGFSGIFGETGSGSFHLWRIAVPGREPFLAWCIQGATADEILGVWAGATVEPIR